MALDYTVKIFDQFYNLNLVVNASEYEVVYSFFQGYTDDAKVAKSFTENLFRISNQTKIPVLELLNTFQGQDKMKVSLTMAYYLNSLGNKTVLYGASSRLNPNQTILRNVDVNGGSTAGEEVTPPSPPPPSPPVADFVGSPLSGTEPLSVSFTDLSTNSPTAWAWDFTNDGIVDSTSQNPTHIYPSAGTYSVKLTASNAGGSDSETKINYITVTVPAPIANFTANTTSGIEPLSVQFTDLSTNSPTSWAWDFTNDGTVDSTLQNPTHIYPSAGTYSVKLTTSNAGGSDSETKIDYITVTTSSEPMVLTFDTNNDGGSPRVALPLFGPVNITVDWGDGTIETITTADIPTHYYASHGIYTVSISGSVEHYGLPFLWFDSARFNLISIDDWGNLGITSLWNGFRGHGRLVSVPPNFPSTVTNCLDAFSSCGLLNDPNISLWDVSNVTNMQAMFAASFAFNQPLDSWDVSNVTNMVGMFSSARAFNQPLNSWNVSNVTQMSSMFNDALSFNQPLDNWDVSNVTEMASMFEAADSFNQPLDMWDVSSVTSMRQMFHANNIFNQPLDSWDVSNVIDMERMFWAARAFNQNLNSWNVSNVTDMSQMFDSALVFNGDITSWNTSSVTNMKEMFSEAKVFNQPIGSWNVGNVTDMSLMFADALAFNQPLDSWDVSNVTDMERMFAKSGYILETSSFNQPLNSWNVANVTNMQAMFANAIFNQPLNNWNTGSVTAMDSMFNDNQFFNQNINSWNTSSVTNMSSMFYGAESFNQPLDNWDVSNVTNMQAMFAGSLVISRNPNIFNQPLNNWDVSSVTNMNSMFAKTNAFNQPLNNWVTDNVANMDQMFYLASAFNQNISNWCVFLIPSEPFSFSSGSPLDSSNKPVWGTCSNPGAVPVANFTGTPLSGVGSVTTNFTDQSTGYITSYAWDFTNNGTTDSTLENPSHTYSSVGTYSVKLTVSNSAGSNSITKPNYITVTAPVPTNDLVLIFDTSFSFDNSVILPLSGTVDVVIDWGDGTPTQAVNTPSAPTHTYATAGVYTVTISGTLTELTDFYIGSNYTTLIAVTSWGNLGITDLSNFCSTMQNLTYLPNYLPSTVTNLSGILSNSNFNGDISNWDTSNVTNMSYMFSNNYSFNNDIGGWDTSSVTDMSNMFYNCQSFNQNISAWDVSSVTTMRRMFYYASNFNQPLGTWNVSSVTDMSEMLYGTWNFNQPIGSWNVSSVTDMTLMFGEARVFNQNINNWNVSNVTSMSDMFYDARAFNQPLDNWNMSSVTTIRSMFYDAISFNQPLNNWNTSSITNMAFAFGDATVFNQPLNNWNVSNVTDMYGMFDSALAFDQPLNNWSTGNVVYMNDMFRNAAAFNQNISNWCVTLIPSEPGSFSTGSPLTESNKPVWGTCP